MSAFEEKLALITELAHEDVLDLVEPEDALALVEIARLAKAIRYRGELPMAEWNPVVPVSMEDLDALKHALAKFGASA